MRIVFQSCLIVFQSGYTILHSHQQYEFQLLHVFANTCYVFLILAILVNVKWYHTVVFICISLMANYCWTSYLVLIDYLCIFLEKFVYSDPLPIFNGLSASLISTCKSSYIYSGDKSFIIWFAYIFFLYDFHFLSSAFWSLNALFWCSLIHHASGIMSKNFEIPGYEDFLSNVFF